MMVVEDIFASIANRLLLGSMIHEQLINYYDFLNLYGYKECHKYHFFEQIRGYREIVEYFMDNYGKLIPQTRFENPSIIPENWYRVPKEDIDINTKRAAIKNGQQKWLTWERETKRFLQQMYRELTDIDEISAALCLKKFLKSVNKEIQAAECKYLEDRSTDFYLPFIFNKQECEYWKYRKKMEREQQHYEYT